MAEPIPEQSSPSFPAPVRIDGYFAWSWRLFRACFWRLATVFVAGVAIAALLHLGVVIFMLEVLETGRTVQALAVSFAMQVTLSAVAGTAGIEWVDGVARRSPVRRAVRAGGRWLLRGASRR